MRLIDGDNEAAVLTRKNAGIRITKNSGRIVAFETRLHVSTIAVRPACTNAGKAGMMPN